MLIERREYFEAGRHLLALAKRAILHVLTKALVPVNVGLDANEPGTLEVLGERVDVLFDVPGLFANSRLVFACVSFRVGDCLDLLALPFWVDDASELKKTLANASQTL